MPHTQHPIELLRFNTCAVLMTASPRSSAPAYDSKNLMEDQIEALERSADITGGGQINLATSPTASRRTRAGITIDVAYRYFATRGPGKWGSAYARIVLTIRRRQLVTGIARGARGRPITRPWIRRAARVVIRTRRSWRVRSATGLAQDAGDGKLMIATEHRLGARHLEQVRRRRSIDICRARAIFRLVRATAMAAWHVAALVAPVSDGMTRHILSEARFIRLCRVATSVAGA